MSSTTNHSIKMRRAEREAAMFGDTRPTPRTKYDADPQGVLHLTAREMTSPHALTTGRAGSYQASGDRRPVVLRPGALAHTQLPSRVGDRLYWPGGYTTDLDGQGRMDRQPR